MKFVISGKMRIKKEWREFSKEIEADTEKYAKEKLYSFLGANNGVKRTEVKIGEVKKL
ncbi:50S ribosomal protein L18a [Candidatus Micrarchaeota archaeon]|nr:50S ribosomal protein L18a [Candidatus Micrarchaeota archaeon]